MSELLPVSPNYLKKHVDYLQENETVNYTDTIRVLPPDVLYYNKYGQYAGMVFTMKPMLKKLKVMIDGVEKTVMYDFPYLLIVYNSSFMLDLYFAFEPIREDTVLFAPMLPNYGGGSSACFGNVKQPLIKEMSFAKLKAGLMNVVFDAIYTSHSRSSVYDEMVAQRMITKYANKANAGEPLGTIKKIVNARIGHGTKNLFEEW